MKKVVLAYSGGLDTSVAVAWLKEQHDVLVSIRKNSDAVETRTQAEAVSGSQGPANDVRIDAARAA